MRDAARSSCRCSARRSCLGSARFSPHGSPLRASASRPPARRFRIFLASITRFSGPRRRRSAEPARRRPARRAADRRRGRRHPRRSRTARQGRAPDAPSLTPEYMAKWEVMRKSRMAGSYEYDNNAKCLPPGMPAMMSMAYGMEVMQTKDKITFFSELNDALRRVYLDGRKPTPEDPGRSDLRGIFDRPLGRRHAGRRHRGAAPELVHRRVHAAQRRDDGQGAHPLHRPRRARGSHHGDRPKALTKPWETVRTYRKAMPGNDQLSEFACAEGLDPFGKK